MASRAHSATARRRGTASRQTALRLVVYHASDDIRPHIAPLKRNRKFKVAAVIRESARETDIVARFGGDEFAVVLPDTGSEGAVAVGDRIRERVAENVFLQQEDINFKLTASVRVSTLPDIAATIDELLQAADDAMYWVKAHGKDGIQLAGGVPQASTINMEHQT